jgi:hypothetical protein
METKKVYIETSIVSYLTARPSSDLVAAAWQTVTTEWWDTRRKLFDLFTSEVVLEEAGRGDVGAAARRLEALTGIPLLTVTDEVIMLSETFIRKGVLPREAIGDSLHIAIAAVHGLDYLLTWNYRHIANAESKPLIRRVCLEKGFGYPEICTPQELMGGN